VPTYSPWRKRSSTRAVLEPTIQLRIVVASLSGTVVDL
jgi:hypothetical protein